MFLNNEQVTEEIKREIKKFLETNENENTTTRQIEFERIYQQCMFTERCNDACCNL